MYFSFLKCLYFTVYKLYGMFRHSGHVMFCIKVHVLAGFTRA